LRRKGKTFSEIMADWVEEDPIAVLNAVSKFTARESRHSGSIITSVISSADAFLRNAAAGIKRQIVDHGGLEP
jgi:hypothetical protein